MNKNSIFEKPREINNIDECYFYHTFNLPGHGLIKGEWDLRDGINDYLGNINFSGKRVLECGTASGYFCFNMERMGADVIAQDLSEKQLWDLVPYYDVVNDKVVSNWKKHINKINNGFWYAHKRLTLNQKLFIVLFIKYQKR